MHLESQAEMLLPALEAVPELIEMVTTSYYAAKIDAAKLLGAIGPEAKDAIPALLQMAEEDHRYRPVVDEAIARIRAK
jgi:hypothetical protein